MENRIILDGYNVIHKIPSLADKLKSGLRAARESLALYMLDWKRNNIYGDICIVFDGRDQGTHSFQKTSLHGIDCYFTKTGSEADDYIIGIVRQYYKSQKILVISDDGKVYNNCKAYGIDTVHPRYLEGQPEKRKAASIRMEGKSIPQQQANEITKWYKEQMNKNAKS